MYTILNIVVTFFACVFAGMVIFGIALIYGLIRWGIENCISFAKSHLKKGSASPSHR